MAEVNITHIRMYLVDNLSLGDIISMMDTFFDLDSEMISGSTKPDKAREFVAWSTRRGYIERLDQIVSVMKIIGQRFNRSELEDMASDLAINLENISGGTGKHSQILKIMVRLQEEHRYYDLINWIRSNRPDIMPSNLLS